MRITRLYYQNGVGLAGKLEKWTQRRKFILEMVWHDNKKWLIVKLWRVQRERVFFSTNSVGIIT